MSNLESFMQEWFPKTEEWDNTAKFILESGIELTDETNAKWLTGYTNISKSSKPHHKDDYTRYMEESMFILHDVTHQIFTLNVEEGITEWEYIKRQIYGELFTFYLTEYIIPTYLHKKHQKYITDRGCYDLMKHIVSYYDENIIDVMWDVFIEDRIPSGLEYIFHITGCWENYEKYSKMFKEDLENSKKNYKLLPKGLNSYCIVGESSQNHIDFFSAVSKGAIKNIKRDFNLTLPEEWV